jgi:antitoxin YefM
VRGARGFGLHARNGSGRGRVGQRYGWVLDFLRGGCGVGASVRIAAISIDIGQKTVHPPLMQTVTYSEARENLKSVIDKVAADRAPVMITRQRGENVVMISASEWAGMEETLYLLRSPKNAERLLEAVRGFEADDAEAVPFP